MTAGQSRGKERERESERACVCVLFHFLFHLFPSSFVPSREPSSPWYTASCGGYSSSRYAGRSSGWNHSWQPKKLDKEHEWNCIVCGESNYYDRARCKGCKEHVGKLLHKKTQQQTAVNAATAKARERQWTRKLSEGHSMRR